MLLSRPTSQSFLLIQINRDCANAVTLIGMVVVVIESLLSGSISEIFLHPTIPLWWHLAFIFNFGGAYLGNLSLAFRLPFPIFLVLKNSSLVVGMAIGLLVGQRFRSGQIAAVLVVTLGIVVATAFQLPLAQQHPMHASSSLYDFLLGTGLLLTSLASFSMLGICQEKTFAVYGKKTNEAMFWQNLLAIPLFFPCLYDISDHISLWNHGGILPLIFILIPN